MITVTYKDDSIKKYNTFEDIVENDLVIKLDCAYNKLKHLPENMNFPNLIEFNCAGNYLSQLPKNMNFPNLIELNCGRNNLLQLPGNMNLPNLKVLNCSGNNLCELPEITNLTNLTILYCNNNYLTHLPENMSLLNLRTINCSDNNITHLPENMNLPNLQHMYCIINQLIHLPENMNLPNLEELFCDFNELSYLPENMHFPNLRIFRCNKNLLTFLPENMILPNLQKLHCCSNKLSHLPEKMNFPNIRELHCYNNELINLPLCILDFHHIEDINCNSNPLELSPQIARFIQRVNYGSVNKLNIYNDTQNIHNSTIQLSVKDSINNITSRVDLPKYNLETLISLILEDPYLECECKKQLIENCDDDSVHTLLLLTFSEVLWFTLQTIHKDFKIETQEEIKKRLNEEMKDAECKCFTGYMNRVINSLNGFTPLVSIQIQDSEQIGNIIVIIKEKLEDSDKYTIETHKELVTKELVERGYTKDSIAIWIEYIE